jgi:hypothetical protein
MKIVIQLIIILAVIGFFACDESDYCLENQQSVQTTFYSAYDDDDTTVSAVSFYGIGRSDSLVYDSAEVDDAYLTLSMFSDTTAYVVDIDGFKDTLYFVHQKELDFVSEDCGFIFRFEIDTVLFTNISFIDSVAVTYSPIIYNEDIENVAIYLY